MKEKARIERHNMIMPRYKTLFKVLEVLMEFHLLFLAIGGLALSLDLLLILSSSSIEIATKKVDMFMMMFKRDEIKHLFWFFYIGTGFLYLFIVAIATRFSPKKPGAFKNESQVLSHKLTNKQEDYA